MAAGIVYLDVDDEITSAAARIRSSSNPSDALVVPYGSRIATSRMNFRLLSREAVVSNRRLSIISGDAASRALAASAGLPVFASVAELEGAEADDDGSAGASPAGRSRLTDPAAAGTLAASETVAGIGPSQAADAEDVGEAPPEAEAVTDETTAVPVVAPPTRPIDEPSLAAPRRETVERRPPRQRPAPSWEDEPLDDRPRPFPRPGTRLLVTLGLVALAVLVAGIGAYLLLPSATIAVTPRAEQISVALTVTADPAASAVSPSDGAVPAMRIDVPVEATQTFKTTGVHVEQAAATGEVTFSNYNFLDPNTVPGGSIVSTEGGIRFKTLATISVPAGTFVLPNVVPGKRSVKVQAVKTGPAGNVPANAIRIAPPGENPDILKVTNDQPTTGGAHTETPEVSQAEVDKAIATLRTQLQGSFEDAVASGASAPPGATLFPRTAVLGDPTPSVDPKTLVGQAIASFDLSLAATGTVIAVDPSPIRSLAEAQLNAKVGANHKLVPDSVKVDVGEGSVDETGTVVFDATARGLRVATLDAATVRALVKGKTADEATAALAQYGEARVEIWPSWARTVTSIDARLDVTVDDTAAASPTRSSPPSPSAAASRRPSASPRPSRSAASGAGSGAP